MMEWTDRHCRFFHRLLTRRALLYTEMLTTGAVLHGDKARLLRYDAAEHPLALQLGGSDPRALAACARVAADLGFDEINLNVGCPSDRVQDGRFGACLMAESASTSRIPNRRSKFSRNRSSAPAPMRSSCMPEKRGSKVCRRNKTATCRRSIMIASIGSRRRIRA